MTDLEQGSIPGGVAYRRKRGVMKLRDDLLKRYEDAVNRAEAAEARAAELQRHLESLTPGGSEYHNDQHRCYEWIAERLRLPVRQQKRISELQAEVERLKQELRFVKGLAPIHEVEEFYKD